MISTPALESPTLICLSRGMCGMRRPYRLVCQNGWWTHQALNACLRRDNLAHSLRALWHSYLTARWQPGRALHRRRGSIKRFPHFQRLLEAHPRARMRERVGPASPRGLCPGSIGQESTRHGADPRRTRPGREPQEASRRQRRWGGEGPGAGARRRIRARIHP